MAKASNVERIAMARLLMKYAFGVASGKIDLTVNELTHSRYQRTHYGYVEDDNLFYVPLKKPVEENGDSDE